MIQHSLRHSSYLEVAKSYYKIWEMPSVQEDQEGAARVVRLIQRYLSAILNSLSGPREHRLLFDTGTL